MEGLDEKVMMGLMLTQLQKHIHLVKRYRTENRYMIVRVDYNLLDSVLKNPDRMFPIEVTFTKIATLELAFQRSFDNEVNIEKEMPESETLVFLFFENKKEVHKSVLSVRRVNLVGLEKELASFPSPPSIPGDDIDINRINTIVLMRLNANSSKVFEERRAGRFLVIELEEQYALASIPHLAAPIYESFMTVEELRERSGNTLEQYDEMLSTIAPKEVFAAIVIYDPENPTRSILRLDLWTVDTEGNKPIDQKKLN